MSQAGESVEDIACEVENRLPTIHEENETPDEKFIIEAKQPEPTQETVQKDEAGEPCITASEDLCPVTKMETETENVLEPVILPEEHPIPMEIPIQTEAPIQEIQPQILIQPAPAPIVEESKKEERPDDTEEGFNSNPQINIEDMKAAQDDLNRLDVLVCGGCHNVFHFVEDFNRHKLQCRRKSNFHGNIAETKPQVWAFLLWKNAQTKVTRRGIVEESSWKLYQKWCKMPERIRNAWIAAGETVMNFTTFGFMKNDSNKKKQERCDAPEPEVEEDKPVVMRKFVQRDHLGEIKEIRPSGVMKKRLKDDIENIRNQLEDGDSSQEKDHEEEKENESRVGFPKVHRVKSQEGEEMLLQEEEFVVEKIVSRRFNPRKKQYEYLIKWEGYPAEQNTWEPAENMEACQHLLKAFEENLTKQSLAKQHLRTGGPVRKNDTNQAGPSGLNSYGRPVRYSKQKALNQVKAWCGSIKPDEFELENSEDEEVATKRIKLELESDSEDSLMGGRIMYTKSGAGGIVKRGPRSGVLQNKRGMTNGAGSNDNLAAALGLESSGDEGDTKAKLSTLAMLSQKSVVNKVSSLSPANQQVLVANAKGVVKIDPSQVPNLTSGVYIMSNKSGIIKLDSVSPSKALSLKQGNVKQATTSAKGGVIMVKNQGPGAQKSGIVRKNPGVLKGGGGGGGPPPRGPGRPANRPSGVIRTNSNTRILPSGTSMNLNNNNRPKVPLSKGGNNNIQRKGVEMEKKILGPKPNRGGFRGGMVYNRGRGGLSRGTASSVSDDMESVSSKGKDGKLMDSDSLLMDFPQDTDSSESEVGLPDDFPIGDLPPLEPESPPRPLTLCPLTGKVLSKAEGEKTPEPTPPPSPKQPTPPPVPANEQDHLDNTVDQNNKMDIDVSKVKSENPSSPTSSYLNRINSSKDVVVKKTLKPGSIGSVTVSPKKILAEAAMENKPEDDMVTITGEDGLIYKVSNSDLGNTLLVSGEDGQQCVYVTTGDDNDDNTAVLTLDPSYADAVAQLSQVGMLGEGENEAQFFVKEGEDGELVGLQVQEGDEPQAQVVAQLVEAGEPAPGGGPRRVVLLLPDGNLMVTEVDEEQYAALELDKFQAASGEIE